MCAASHQPVPPGLEGDHRVAAVRRAPPPDVVLGQLGELDVPDQRVHRRRRPREPEARQLPHRAAPPVAADEVTAADRLVPGLDRHALRVLLDPRHLGRPPHPDTEPRGPVLQQHLDGGLQDHQRQRMPGLELVEVEPEPGEVPHPLDLPESEEGVQDPALIQHLQGPRVHPAGPGLARPLREPFEQHHVGARQPQLAGEHQARRPRTRDHDVRVHPGVSHVVSRHSPHSPFTLTEERSADKAPHDREGATGLPLVPPARQALRPRVVLPASGHGYGRRGPFRLPGALTLSLKFPRAGAVAP